LEPFDAQIYSAGIEKKEQDATTEEIVSKYDSINGGVVQL